MSLIGVDIGTTGCKCTVFNEEGVVLSYSYKEYVTENPHPGYYELNPVTVWEAVKDVIYHAIDSYKGEQVKAISVSSFGEAAVPVDKQGNVLGNSILYMDSRGNEQCKQIEGTMGRQKLMELTGIPAHPMYTINKVMWIKENMPQLYQKTWKFMLFGDFIIYRLTGSAAIDYSLASRTMAFNVVTKKWEQEIFKTAGINIELFSEPLPSATIVGGVKKEVAEELGLPLNALVVTGGHDQVCAALGAGILSEGLAIDGIGTVECITPAFCKPVLNVQMLDNNFSCTPHAKDGMYATYAFNFTGGSLLKWYRDCFARYELEQAVLKGQNVYSILDEKAAKEPTSLLLLPHFAGAGTPYMDPYAKGAILGLSFDNTASEIYRAMLEGVSYEMAFNMECLQNAGVNIHTLRAVGGGAKSDLWLQIKADIMHCKVERLNVDEAGTLGTAIMAGTAIGVYNSMEEAAKKLIKVKKEFYPNREFSGIYTENYERYKKLYQSIGQIFKDC